MDSHIDPTPLQLDELIATMKRNNELIEIQTRQQRDWKIALRNGIMAGFGSFIGAVILVAILVKVLQPLSYFNALKPSIDRIANALDGKKK